MPFQKKSYQMQRQDDDEKFNLIIQKLIKTVIRFIPQYPDLKIITNFLETTEKDLSGANPYHNYLILLVDFIEEHSHTSYVFRHLHYNISNDVRNLQEGSALNDHMLFYLETAG